MGETLSPFKFTSENGQHTTTRLIVVYLSTQLSSTNKRSTIYVYTESNNKKHFKNFKCIEYIL